MLLTKENVVKLGDFGFAKNLSSTVGRTYAGSPAYMSPELNAGLTPINKTNCSTHDLKTDIWFDYFLKNNDNQLIFQRN